MLATALPMDYRLRVMGKEELFRNPILAWAIRVGGAFPVNRGGADIQAVKTAIQTIQSGQNLLIFPEGTTIRNGIGKADGLPAHAHSGAAVIGVRTGAILVPVFVDGEKRTFHRTRIIIGQPYTPVYTGRQVIDHMGVVDEVSQHPAALGLLRCFLGQLHGPLYAVAKTGAFRQDHLHSGAPPTCCPPKA